MSQYSEINLHKKIFARKELSEGNLKGAIERGFLDLDQQMRIDEETKDDDSGTTAVVVLIKEGYIYCGRFFSCERDK